MTEDLFTKKNLEELLSKESVTALRGKMLTGEPFQMYRIVLYLFPNKLELVSIKSTPYGGVPLEEIDPSLATEANSAMNRIVSAGNKCLPKHLDSPVGKALMDFSVIEVPEGKRQVVAVFDGFAEILDDGTPNRFGTITVIDSKCLEMKFWYDLIDDCARCIFEETERYMQE
jgi:hypothetical protein